MADGTTKAIKDVEVGDEVVATDPETGETSAQPVTDLHVNLDRELTTLTLASLSVLGLRTIGEGEGDRSTRGPTEAAVSTLETTQNHPFWDVAADEWVDAADLVPGRSVVTSPTGERQLVVAVDNYTGAAEMRDLTVANIHTYYVLAGTAPVLVHNNNNDCEVDVYHAVPDDSVADSVLAGIDWERLNPNSRFGRALYVASRPETAVAEVRHHKGNPGTLMHFKLDLSLAKILDLTNPDMADSLGYRWSGKITEHTQRIGEVARQLGYNVIKYPSLRGGGDNWAIIADFDQLLTYVGRRPV